MKCFIIFVVVCATIGFSEQAIPKEQALEMKKNFLSQCAGKEGASAADVDEAMAKKLPSTQQGKCLHACMGETLGLMVDKKLSLEGNIALVKKVFDDDATKIQITTELVNECSGMTDGDRCEAAYKIHHCIGNAVKSRGLSMDEW